MMRLRVVVGRSLQVLHIVCMLRATVRHKMSVTALIGPAADSTMLGRLV